MSIEKQFTKDMIEIYHRADKECGYRATRFLQVVGEKGGVAAAKSLISKSGGTDGFAKLWELRRLDLSVEALVLREEYSELFTQQEKDLCKSRLKDYGYNI
ncbi:MAG: hypothetical protein K0R93_673 [Anaerosolibacter sp.]|jgi:hypothetical protein|uniref:hypothetical protein n=1 Tax=Anaerosolibacter sp. TaxID=1872527 RepID=UPI0026115F1B|nr:hypothetical protein [Anaerosolibacter sp.]MDF2545775.1 hypothetical protein [Anaerosolibacter sp.]